MAERVAGTVRLTVEVRETVDRYAASHGLRYNAAVSLLVAKGLIAEGFPPPEPPKPAAPGQ